LGPFNLAAAKIRFRSDQVYLNGPDLAVAKSLGVVESLGVGVMELRLHAVLCISQCLLHSLASIVAGARL
jgi:hypothetical protein